MKYHDGTPIREGDHVTLKNGEVDARECRTIGYVKSVNDKEVLVEVHEIGGEMISDAVQGALYELEDKNLIEPKDYDFFEADLTEDGEYKEGGEKYQFQFYNATRDLVKVAE